MTKIEDHHHAGLRFDWILVREVSFEDNLSEDDSTTLSNLQATVDLKTSVSDDHRSCRTYLKVMLKPAEGAAAPFVRLAAAVEGQFSIEGEATPSVAIDEFVRKQAPAILFPFLRQAVASATSTSRFGQVLLPPINVVALVAEGARAGS
ncbi:MAG TPA: protein-export chaperone SecB [Gemmatimonadales bacterium]